MVLANGQPIPCLLLANKCDINGVTIDKKALDQFAKEHNFIAWYPTSAQNNVNIDDAVRFLVGKILEIEANAALAPYPPPADPSTGSCLCLYLCLCLCVSAHSQRIGVLRLGLADHLSPVSLSNERDDREQPGARKESCIDQCFT